MLMPVQAAEAEVVQEERTVPGEDPGIYACDYKKLARIQLLTAAGRLAMLSGDDSAAEVVCHIVFFMPFTPVSFICEGT